MSPIIYIVFKTLFWGSFLATFYTYFLYPLLLAGASRLTRRRRRREEAAYANKKYQLPTVTMIVSAYNEEDAIGDKIANCRSLDYPADKLTFLFGSDGSTDGTNALLRAAADERIRVLIAQTRQGKVGMLNRLMQEATSELVVFSDANTMYEPQALRELVRPFMDARVGCTIGKLELTVGTDKQACTTEGLYWRYENHLKKLENELGSVPSINGGIFAIRRELFEELPSQTVTEDQVLGMKIMTKGYRCHFCEKAQARENVSTWSGELRRRMRISAGNFQSLFLAPRILYPGAGRVWFAFVSHKLLRWLAPFFLALMLTSNIVLAGQAFYGSTLLAQGLFYVGGILGTLVPKMTGMLKLLAVPRYFLAMNVAILIGLSRFLRGKQRVTWAKTQR